MNRTTRSTLVAVVAAVAVVEVIIIIIIVSDVILFSSVFVFRTRHSLVTRVLP